MAPCRFKGPFFFCSITHWWSWWGAVLMILYLLISETLSQQDIPDPYTIPSFFASGILETGNVTRAEYKLPQSEDYITTVKRDPYIDGNYLVFLDKTHRFLTTADFKTYAFIAGSNNGFSDGAGDSVRFSSVWGFEFYGSDMVIIPQGSLFAGTRILNRTDNSVRLLMPTNMKDDAQTGKIFSFRGNQEGNFSIAQHGYINDITRCGEPGVYYMTDFHAKDIKVINMTSEEMYTLWNGGSRIPRCILWRPHVPDKLFIGFSQTSLDELDLNTFDVKRVIKFNDSGMNSWPVMRRLVHEGWTIADAVIDGVEHLSSWTDHTIFVTSRLLGINIIDFKTGWVTSICRGDNTLPYNQSYEAGPVGTCAFGNGDFQYTLVDNDRVLIFERDVGYYYIIPYSVRADSIWTTEYYTQNESTDFFMGVTLQYAMLPSTLTTTATTTTTVTTTNIITSTTSATSTSTTRVPTNEKTDPSTGSNLKTTTSEEKNPVAADNGKRKSALSAGATAIMVCSLIPLIILLALLGKKFRDKYEELKQNQSEQVTPTRTDQS